MPLDAPNALNDTASTALPRQLVRLADDAADDLELLLGGAFAPLRRYLTAAENASVTSSGCLPDGTGWELPLSVRVPAAAEQPAVGDTVVLSDHEAVPVAALTVSEVVTADAQLALAGDVSRLQPRTEGAFARLRLPADAVRAESAGRVLVVPASRPLYLHEVDAAAERARQMGGALVLLALVGTGQCHPDAVVRALLAAAAQVACPARVRVVPLATHDELDPRSYERLVVRVAAAYGADEVMLPFAATAPDIGADLPVPTGRTPAGPLDETSLHALLAAGDPLPEGFVSPAVERELRRMHPPLTRRGLTVLFTGLSGSGKSTLARAVAAALTEGGERTVTLLDGDRVRALLSAGLTFSREDREANVQRIGYVAAEVTRHGGTALCAPIAPYDTTRREVRKLVQLHGEFVLVHVSTPLEVCEARDRKGLYALARAGRIPLFTGVSDPYEVPTDADLVIDTSAAPLSACTDAVLSLLRRRGLIAAVGEDASS